MILSSPENSRIVCAATVEFPRHSEADVIPLTDGRLLLSWARKIDGDDCAQGCIMGLYSADEGRTWDAEPHVIRSVWEEVSDAMSVSFCRSPRGIHLLFIGRDIVPPGHNVYDGLSKIFQMISTDEGATWSSPHPISSRRACLILNNARVIRTDAGRIIVPLASVPGNIFTFYNEQRVHCVYSDDDGRSWHESNELAIIGLGLMEPGVAECSDGSIYMTIRTKKGFLYEARSYDQGATWGELKQSDLASAEAPATVTRDPRSGDLWMLWCNTPYTGKWYDRHDIAIAISKDCGKTWGQAYTIEHDENHSYGYISATFLSEVLLLTYYDWKLDKERSDPEPFHMTSIRQRTIRLADIYSLNGQKPAC